MRISAKSRYALASLVHMGQTCGHENSATISSMAESLGISKIYLEQVFSLLKRGGVVTSTKGAQGGYQLARPMSEITAHHILSAIELSLFEPAGQTVPERAPGLEHTLQTELFAKLDDAISDTLRQITLEQLAATAQKHSDGTMYYI